jgi:hypothetical protein
MATPFESYSAFPCGDRVQVTANAPNTADDPLGVGASESALFGWQHEDGAVSYLVERGCDPTLATLMVAVAARGYHSVEYWPAGGRVEVLGENRHHRHSGPY